MECGKIAQLVLKQNGHLFCFSDLKIASIIGIPVAPSNEINTSILVITDNDRNILAIYKNVYYKDIKNILEDFLNNL